MERKLEDTNLVDLIADKYFKLKKIKEKMWNDTNNSVITNSEWFIISLIYGKQPMISEIKKQVNISRQATHKTIKTLNSKDLIVINNVENNNKNKCLKLTPLGEKCFIENKRLKEKIEQEIVNKLGSENVAILKELLEDEWNS